MDESLVLPLRHGDARDIAIAISRARAKGRRLEAIEVNPTRRTAAGAWKLIGVDLISNGLVPPLAFDLKLRGRGAVALDTERCYFADAALTAPPR